MTQARIYIFICAPLSRKCHDAPCPYHEPVYQHLAYSEEYPLKSGFPRCDSLIGSSTGSSDQCAAVWWCQCCMKHCWHWSDSSNRFLRWRDGRVLWQAVIVLAVSDGSVTRSHYLAPVDTRHSVALVPARTWSRHTAMCRHQSCWNWYFSIAFTLSGFWYHQLFSTKNEIIM